MAPVVGSSILAQKRPLSMLEDEVRPSKKRRQSYHRHHSLRYKAQAIPASEPAILEQDSLDILLVGAIKIVCEEQAARHGIQNPIIESLALEAFRNVAEEFILKFCEEACLSMVSARRTAPIPTDFESAIKRLDLPWPDDQLEPFVTEPTSNPPLLPTPPPEDVFHREHQLPTAILGPGLDGRRDKNKDRYIPSHLPAFPSQHTYKDTPVFPDREVDPRRIRELATEEGKLGEEALRRLAGAVKVEATVSPLAKVKESEAVATKRVRRGPEESMESMFEATMRELLNDESTSSENKFELGPIVNCEKRYLMQDSTPARGRPPARNQSDSTATAGSTGPAVVMSAKARGKQRAVGSETKAKMEWHLEDAD